MKLYIFGNGFDLAHNLKTKYSDYRDFIDANIEKHKKWEIIKEYYPSNYDFWSDAETNVCNIDLKRYYEPRVYFGELNDLDDLASAISESFNKFILEVNQTIEEKPKIFELDKDAFFLTFNYTETLETLYGIPKERIIHLHNSTENAVMKELFGLDDVGCILGHAEQPDGFKFHSQGKIGLAKDYAKFIRRTAKPTKQIIEKNELGKKLILLSQIIDEVVYYGFSFSPADRPYLQEIMIHLSPKAIKHTIYAHSDVTDVDELKRQLMIKVGLCGGSIFDINVINDKDKRKI